MNIQKAKVTSKGQLTLPKSIRDRLNLEKGSYIAIYLEKDQLVMKKVNPKKPLSDADPIWDLVGMFHDGCEGQETPRENRVENKVTPFREASKWKQS
ncbi:MAG TPA: AbrB family transcriptional regulator [Desulfotomaculum sp.]|nr:AbrB family transcriptional regulator [Desulfotomaculum sp.]